MGLQVQYESVADASMRLRSSVVLYDGVPHYIESIDEPPAEDAKEIFRVRCAPLPLGAGASIRKYISSKKFDLAPFPMGFLNTPAGAVFCSRAPARQQSQGLTSKNLLSELVGGAPAGVDPYGRPLAPRGQGVSFEDFIRNPNVPKMVAGVYPSFAEACASAKKGVSMAFARELAVVADADLPFLMYLYFKTVKVGIVVDGQVQLGPKRKCLKELLAERNVNVKE